MPASERAFSRAGAGPHHVLCAPFLLTAAGSVQCSGMNRAAKGPTAYPTVLGLAASSPGLDAPRPSTVDAHDRRGP